MASFAKYSAVFILCGALIRCNSISYHDNGALFMKFRTVAEYFAKIEATPGRVDMTKLLAELLTEASAQEAQIIADFSLGQLRPPYIGTQFNFAEKNFENALADLLDKDVASVKAAVKQAGDVGSVVGEGTWETNANLTVLDVFSLLEQFEAISGEGSQERKSKAIVELLKKLDPLSAKYVVRIILGTLRLGFSDMTLIDALSWMEVGDKSLKNGIEHAYNICVDIGLITKTLKEEGAEALRNMQIHVGIPIRPAAAERLPTAADIVEKMGDCVAQPKLDGFRLQIHVKKDADTIEIHFFSRNLIDMSSMFPDLVDELKKLDVKELICEGEAIVFDPNTGSFVPFQETVKRKRKHGIEQAASEYPLKLYLFDILYLNGTSLLNETHEERRKKMLEVAASAHSNIIIPIEEEPIHSAYELELYFAQNIDAGLEGLVVKKPNSHYQPGKRNFNWIKLKKHQTGQLEDTLDCVVLGYYAGSGKRAGFGIGAFLVGVFNKAQDCFQTVAKIGTGLTDQEWKDLKERCDEAIVAEKPKNVECPRELYPSVWVDPKIVCSIRADEITMSPLHTAGKTEKNLGYALRFPRIMGYRPDKSPEEATQVSEVKRLFEDQFSQRA
jgi:DNA ligase-1